MEASGIRLVEHPGGDGTGFSDCVKRGGKVPGDGRMYMEKYLNPVKHIEVQLLADEKAIRYAWASGNALFRKQPEVD